MVQRVQGGVDRRRLTADPEPGERQRSPGFSHVETPMFLVSYLEPRYAREPLVVQQRHRKLRCYRTEAEAAAFVNSCWASGRWRVVELVEVRREAGCWVPLRPF
jgi:hypothetical protein